MGRKVQFVYEVDVDEVGEVNDEDDPREGVTLETATDKDLIAIGSDRWGHDMSIFMRLAAVVRADGRRVEVERETT